MKSMIIIVLQSACLLEPPNSVENYYSELLFNVHVKDVVTDWSYALAGFLVPTGFLVFPRPILAITLQMFFYRI